MGRRSIDMRREIIAPGNSADGFATTDQDARDDALRRDYRATQTRTLAPRGRRDRPCGRDPHQHRRATDGPRRLAHRPHPARGPCVPHAFLIA